MWDQGYVPVAGSLAWSAVVASLSDPRAPHRTRRASTLGVEVGSSRSARRDTPRGHRLPHAGAARARCHGLWRGVRALPDRVDRVLGRRALSTDGRDRPVRDHQELRRPAHAGSARAGTAHRLRLRRVHRRRSRLRHSRGRGRGDADRFSAFRRSTPRRSASSPTPRRSPSAPSARRSSRWKASPSCRWQRSAPTWAASARRCHSSSPHTSCW